MCDAFLYADELFVDQVTGFEADLYRYGFIAGSLYIFICRKTRKGRCPENIS